MRGITASWMVFVIVAFVATFESYGSACVEQKPCVNRCPFRYQHDSNGCNTCKCCPVLRCPFCWRGYIIAKNDNQCLSCHCKWGL
uniref:Antistasin-like domain-containing protein n=1 Tax=Magallana gigas TaxID=29159 RepID=A0A8W8K9G1_MAGGI